MNWLKSLKDWWNYLPCENRYPEITEQIICMIARDSKYGFVEILPETKFSDLNFDSLDVIELIMDLEDYYDIYIDNGTTEWEDVNSVIDLSNYIGEIRAK